MLPCNTFVPVNGKTKLPKFLRSQITLLQLYAEIHTLHLKQTLLLLSYLVCLTLVYCLCNSLEYSHGI